MVLHNAEREEYMWNPGDPLGWQLVLFCPLQQKMNISSNSGLEIIPRVSEPSERKIWVTPPGKLLRSNTALAEGEGNLEWRVEMVKDENGFSPNINCNY